MKRRIWNSDETVEDFFDSPSFGILWLGSSTDMVMDLSRLQAAHLLGCTVEDIQQAEKLLVLRAFFVSPAS